MPATDLEITRSAILVVDDKQTNVEALSTILQDEGYAVTGASDGPAALAMVRKEPPDLILLDIVMPEMDGFAVCRELKADSGLRDIPIIFLTALDQTGDVVRGFEIGAADYIIKPVNVHELLARVRTHLVLRFQAKQLQSLADRDGLTLLANRRRFDEFLDLEYRRCTRDKCPVSLIMIDIDYFKNYNDNYGHLAGDRVLKRVAETIASFVNRPGDLAARYGGEEFAVVLGGTEGDRARQLAEKIRLAVLALDEKHGYSATAEILTISLGVATHLPEPGMTKDSLIVMADKQLYAAKQAGRNMVS